MHVPGQANVVPDELSRHPDMAPGGTEGAVMNVADGGVPLLQQICAAQDSAAGESTWDTLLAWTHAQ